MVFLPSRRYGSFSVDTSYQPERLPRLGGQAAGVGDQAIDERDRRAVERAFIDERALHVTRQEYARVEAGRVLRMPPSRSRRCRRRAQRALSRRARALWSQPSIVRAL